MPDNRAVPQRLVDGKADAVISDTAEARDWLRAGLRVVGPFRFDYKAYLLPAGDDALAVRVDEWMVAREADGWLPAERERWLGMPAKTNPAAATREAIAALIGLRLDLMLPMAAAKRAAGRPIEDPAREEDVLDQRARAVVAAGVQRGASTGSSSSWPRPCSAARRQRSPARRSTTCAPRSGGSTSSSCASSIARRRRRGDLEGRAVARRHRARHRRRGGASASPRRSQPP